MIIIVIVRREPVEVNIGEPVQISEETQQKIVEVAGKASLIYIRIVLGIIIMILSVVILFDSFIFRQTIIARNYAETTATYKEGKNEIQGNSEIYYDVYIYIQKGVANREKDKMDLEVLSKIVDFKIIEEIRATTSTPEAIFVKDIKLIKKDTRDILL